MAAQNLPTVGLVTTEFSDFARQLLEQQQASVTPLVEVGHPVGGVAPEVAADLITESVYEAIVASLLPAKNNESDSAGAAERTEQTRAAEVQAEESEPVDFEVTGDEVAVTAEMHRRGMTDGLPVVVPTRERVDEMCAGATRYPLESLGSIAPLGGAATILKIASNAVMAGCQPEHMPVIEAATEAIQEDEFNLVGMQTTTHPCALLSIVHGPVAETLSMNSGAGCMGHGNQANATIGRAMRLVMQNIGGAHPGKTDKATQGTPAKYSWCFAENEAESPWPSLRESLGFHASDSCVTVAAAEGPHNINDHGSTDAEGVLNTIAQTMTTLGNNHIYVAGDHFVVFGPEHAKTVADSGFSREDVQAYLYENARIDASRFTPGKYDEATSWGGYADRLEAWGNRIPLVREPESFRILVAGGPGKHSTWIPTFAVGTTQTRAIQLDAELCVL